MDGEATKLELSNNRKGAIAEAAIAWHATRLGVDVYRPLAEHGRFDMIFDLGERLLRVQCKWAQLLGDVVSVRLVTCRRSRGGALLRRRYESDEIDAIAAYCPGLDRSYLMPVELIAGRSQIYLRLAPSRNNQAVGIKWAEQYELPGAIAQLGER